MLETQLGRFGDKRLVCVSGALLASVQRKRTLCVSRLAKDRNQAVQVTSKLVTGLAASWPTRR